MLSLHARAALALMRPMTCDGLRKIRIGAENDGGYVMADEFEFVDAAFSFGVGVDDSWDAAVAERLRIPVMMFDHTIDAPPSRNELLRWKPIGLGIPRDPDPHKLPLDQIMRMSHYGRSSKALLKIDIEGDEWAALATVAPHVLARFLQIIVEFHNLPDMIDSGRALMTLANLRAAHRCIHAHANNCGGVSEDGVPQTVEATWLRCDGRKFAPSTEAFPSAIDQPNDPALPDIRIGCFDEGHMK